MDQEPGKDQENVPMKMVKLKYRDGDGYSAEILLEVPVGWNLQEMREQYSQEEYNNSPSRFTDWLIEKGAHFPEAEDFEY